MLVLIVFVAICWQAIPVKIQSAELYGFMEDQAESADRSTAEQIKARVLRRAKDLDLPLEAKNLKVEKSSGRIRIECTYTVPLEFPGYTYYWEFDQEIDRPVFVF
jgi:hypothetical protein